MYGIHAFICDETNKPIEFQFARDSFVKCGWRIKSLDVYKYFII